MSHYGYLRTIQTYKDLQKHVDDLQRHLDTLNGDESWMGVCYVRRIRSTEADNNFQSPLQARTEAAIKHVKNEKGKIQAQQLAFEAGLLDSDLTFRSIGFTSFLSTWLIRQVDPKKTHPNPLIQSVYFHTFSKASRLKFGFLDYRCPRKFQCPSVCFQSTLLKTSWIIYILQCSEYLALPFPLLLISAFPGCHQINSKWLESWNS